MCLLLKSKCLLKEERSKSLGNRRQKRPRGSGNPYSTGSRALGTAAWLSLCSLHFCPDKGDWHWSALLGSPIQTVN